MYAIVIVITVIAVTETVSTVADISARARSGVLDVRLEPIEKDTLGTRIARFCRY
jgi:response regulator of citrate/malate metabolism